MISPFYTRVRQFLLTQKQSAKTNYQILHHKYVYMNLDNQISRTEFVVLSFKMKEFQFCKTELHYAQYAKHIFTVQENSGKFQCYLAIRTDVTTNSNTYTHGICQHLMSSSLSRTNILIRVHAHPSYTKTRSETQTIICAYDAQNSNRQIFDCIVKLVAK